MHNELLAHHLSPNAFNGYLKQAAQRLSKDHGMPDADEAEQTRTLNLVFERGGVWNTGEYTINGLDHTWCPRETSLGQLQWQERDLARGRVQWRASPNADWDNYSVGPSLPSSPS